MCPPQVVMNVLDYLNRTLGLTATVTPWVEADRFPLYLRNGKKYSLLHVAGMECVLIEADAKSFSLPAFQKQRKKLPAQPEHIVLCFRRLESRQRKALIEAKIPFIVPESQVYLPFLGIVLQERMKPVEAPPKKLSPSAQFVLLFLIRCSAFTGHLRKVDLAKLLGLSAMDVTRAVQQLTALGLLTVKKAGRCDLVDSVYRGKALYEKALPYMIDPVQKRVYVRDRREFALLPPAGESALANRSLLSEPTTACRAISRKEYKQLPEIEELDPAWSSDGNYIQLELWKYAPETFADNLGVDAISLSLSLGGDHDERIEQAVEEMMEESVW